MDPNQFRETRIEISQLCESIQALTDINDEETSKKKIDQAGVLLKGLTPKAEGEIQERSVKNLGLKIKAATSLIDKMKTTKKPSAKSKNAIPVEIIDWNEERLSTLSNNYLSKVLTNKGSDKDPEIRFGTIGKGVRPSYQIYFENGKSSAFSGSSHKLLKKKLPKSSQKISQPFPFSILESIIKKK